MVVVTVVEVRVNAESFVDLIKLASVLRDEIALKVDEKVTVSGTDYGSIGLIYAELDAEVKGKGMIPLKIDVLKKVLSKICSKREYVDIILDDKIYIKCGTVFEVTPVKDIVITKKPELSFDVSCSVSTVELRRAVELAFRLSDTITFCAESGEIKVLAEGFDCKLEAPLAECEIKDTCRARYNAHELLKFVRMIPAKSVELKLSTDYPLCLSFERGDLYVEYLLAPVV